MIRSIIVLKRIARLRENADSTPAQRKTHYKSWQIELDLHDTHYKIDHGSSQMREEKPVLPASGKDKVQV